MVRNQFAKTLELAREHLYARKWQNKKYYDEKTNEIELKPGDMVLIKNQTKKYKFDDIYDGPYEVIDVGDTYVEIMKGTKRTKLHKNFTKKVERSNDNG